MRRRPSMRSDLTLATGSENTMVKTRMQRGASMRR
jgi:hypothetical protein